MTPTELDLLAKAAQVLEAKMLKHHEKRAELRALLAQLDAFLTRMEDDPYGQ